MSRHAFPTFCLCLVTAMMLSILPPGVAVSQTQEAQPAYAASPSSGVLHSSPVAFLQNAGQWDGHARFQVWGSAAAATWLTEDEIWLTVVESPVRGGLPSGPERDDPRPDAKPRVGANIRLSFAGANSHPVIEPLLPLGTRVSFFLGSDPDGWRPEVPTWGGVRYVDLYPGIDLELTSEAGKAVARLVTEPGADLGAVRLCAEGAEAVTIGYDFLLFHTAAGDVSWPLLRVPEATAEPSVMVTDGGAYEIAAPFAGGQPMQAEPSPDDNLSDLLYGTFLGGGSDDLAEAIALDGAGAAYVVGWTGSLDFPVTPGAFDPSLNSSDDAFVAKLSADGSSLEYATFLGGSQYERGKGIAVDASGVAYVTGGTMSEESFPTTPGAFDTTCDWLDVFAVKLSASGSALEYSTCLGGASNDLGSGIAVDESGAAYIAGETGSGDFPATPGAFDTSLNGGYDAFIAKVDASGSDLAYATFLGGPSDDKGYAIALDSSGAAYITGSALFDLYTTPASFDPTYNGGYDAFVAKLSASGSEVEYSTYIGGTSDDAGVGIAVDAVGAAVIAGSAGHGGFPTTDGAFDTTYNGGWSDAVVTRLNPEGSALEYSTYLGGSSDDSGQGIVLDHAGAAYVVGLSASPDFPTTPGAFDTSYNGGPTDVFVTELDAAGSALAYGTFLGGESRDHGYAIALGEDGTAYVTGYTVSSLLRTTAGAFDTSYNGWDDGFVARLGMELMFFDQYVYLPLAGRHWPPIPDAPLLSPIDNSDGNGDYMVSWSASGGATAYTLQEDDNDAFSSPTTAYSGSSTSVWLTGTAPGVHYYRVNASNEWGSSPWSNVEVVIVYAPGWTTLLSTDFEGAFPDPWLVFDNNGSDYGEYFWAKRNCRAYAGSYSGWAVGGGANGSPLGCGANYPNDAESWMVYGPFSLTAASAADLTFRLWLSSEAYDDGLAVLASIDGTNFHGSGVSGNSGGWILETLDLTDVPSLGSLLGQDEVWIALVFLSGSSNNLAEGCYVDDFVLRMYVGYAGGAEGEVEPILPEGVRERAVSLRINR